MFNFELSFNSTNVTF